MLTTIKEVEGAPPQTNIPLPRLQLPLSNLVIDLAEILDKYNFSNVLDTKSAFPEKADIKLKEILRIVSFNTLGSGFLLSALVRKLSNLSKYVDSSPMEQWVANSPANEMLPTLMRLAQGEAELFSRVKDPIFCCLIEAYAQAVKKHTHDEIGKNTIFEHVNFTPEILSNKTMGMIALNMATMGEGNQEVAQQIANALIRKKDKTGDEKDILDAWLSTDDFYCRSFSQFLKPLTKLILKYPQHRAALADALKYTRRRIRHAYDDERISSHAPQKWMQEWNFHAAACGRECDFGYRIVGTNHIRIDFINSNAATLFNQLVQVTFSASSEKDELQESILTALLYASPQSFAYHMKNYSDLMTHAPEQEKQLIIEIFDKVYYHLLWVRLYETFTSRIHETKSLTYYERQALEILKNTLKSGSLTKPEILQNAMNIRTLVAPTVTDRLGMSRSDETCHKNKRRESIFIQIDQLMYFFDQFDQLHSTSEPQIDVERIKFLFEEIEEQIPYSSPRSSSFFLQSMICTAQPVEDETEVIGVFAFRT